ncbi:histidine-type phosphatase [Acinetobacter soli]|uniref:histidine-type phosphatase n=1 Tax=Acinetobacter soli TaxID=487316 RepID=UPI00125E3220|nr:histidine-type phosphatase [Acinetobacter soli]MCF3128718.1 histidine-type phosphatase [Acinetobacter soli]
MILTGSGLIGLTGCNDSSNDDSTTTTSVTTNTSGYFQTKTPYQAQQSIGSYQAAPAGFEPVFTELVARHGSRGLSSMKYDLALYNLWKQAKTDNALTPLGEKLGSDLEAMMKANIVLGYGVEGIRQPGYGNETTLGIDEHRGIADRLLQRLPQLFSVSAMGNQDILVQSSGVDRAVDSAKFFSNELIRQNAALSGKIRPASYTILNTSLSPTVQDQGVDRFLLYFHSLNKDTDASEINSSFKQRIFDASMNYQNFESNDLQLQQKLKQLSSQTQAQQVALTVLVPLFKDAFIQKLGTPGYTFSNTGSFSATAPDGTVVTEKGKGKNTISSAVDAAAYLYELYSIAPGMKKELVNTDFAQYMPREAAKFYAEYNDANDFYEKGPSFTESDQVTSMMAQGLKQDFFNQVDALMNQQQSHKAVLRFAHAEIIIPLATAFELKGMMTPLPLVQTYSYSNSAWRGEDISPMAANMQWDIYQNAQGYTLVKMLYNEKETLFKSNCDYARYAPNSYFYDYLKLKQCYNISNF